METIEQFLDEKVNDDWADISVGECEYLIRLYATKVAEAVRQECFNEWGDKNMQDPDSIDIEQFLI